MQPVMVMFMGTCADIRPIRTIFSPVSGWKAESYAYLALHSWSSVSPGVTTPALWRMTGKRQVILGGRSAPASPDQGKSGQRTRNFGPQSQNKGAPCLGGRTTSSQKSRRAPISIFLVATQTGVPFCFCLKAWSWVMMVPNGLKWPGASQGLFLLETRGMLSFSLGSTLRPSVLAEGGLAVGHPPLEGL